MIGLTDAIQKLDLNLEGMVKKIEKQHKDLDPTWDIKISTTDGDSIIPPDLLEDVLKYLKEFSWEDGKFPRSLSLPELATFIQNVGSDSPSL